MVRHHLGATDMNIYNVTNQQLAAERFDAYDKEITAFTFGPWATMTSVAAQHAGYAEIEARHGYRHGWMTINGEGFNHETAFPHKFFPRFPADQGLND